uniref:WD40/YVTN/BNR-like repeat-containing protein n=1 Tax=Flavobacterium sp. TaxID=239 RepID=UPI00286BEA80
MKTKIYLLLLFLMTINSFSQETKMSIKDFINFSDLPSKNSETPSWANQFYDNPDQINVNKLKSDVNDWVIAEKKERKDKVRNENENEPENELKESVSENPIVRFAINFVNKVPNNYINEVGFINMPTREAFTKDAENQEKSRTNNYNKTNNKNVLVNNWSQIGSKEIVENGEQIVSSTCIYYISVAPTSTNIRLASGETGLVYKTTDGGANWNTIAQTPGPSAFHPTDVNKIILGSNPFRLSSDGGATWTVKPVAAICNEILWSSSGSIILASTNQGIYVSNDGGLNFSLKQAGSFMDVEFKPGSSTIAYAVNNAGVFYKSTDGGLTWTVKPTTYNVNINRKGFLIAVSDANPDLVSIASLSGINFDTDNKVELIKSTNSGENFASLSVTNIKHSQGYYDFVFGISPVNENTYFVGVCSFFKSIDGGITFNVIGGYDPPFRTHPDMQDMVLFGNTVVLSTDGGVSESSDGYTSLSNWKSTCKGLVGLDYWGFDLGFNTDQMGGGKFHNGNSMYNPEWNNGKAIYVYGAEEADGKAIFSRPNSMYFSGEAKDFKQIDINYNPNYASTFPFTLENNLYYFGERNSDTTSNTTDSNIIYAGTGNSIVISYDNGVTSQVLKDFGSLVWDIKTTRKDAKVIYVMTQSTGLWKTSNAGLNWTLCKLTFNNVDLTPNGRYLFIDISQTNTNEIWLTYNKEYTTSRIFKSTDGGQVWTDLNTPILNDFQSKQIVHQYGTNGGVYLMGQAYGTSKCYYRNNTMTDWVDYSSNLVKQTATARNVFLKPSYFKEKLRVAGTIGVQEISFYEKSNPVAQPTTNIKDVCVNQEIKFSDYSILDYTGATWEWSFSKTPIYLNGTSAGSRDPIVKFLSPG